MSGQVALELPDAIADAGGVVSGTARILAGGDVRKGARIWLRLVEHVHLEQFRGFGPKDLDTVLLVVAGPQLGEQLVQGATASFALPVPHDAPPTVSLPPHELRWEVVAAHAADATGNHVLGSVAVQVGRDPGPPVSDPGNPMVGPDGAPHSPVLDRLEEKLAGGVLAAPPAAPMPAAAGLRELLAAPDPTAKLMKKAARKAGLGALGMAPGMIAGDMARQAGSKKAGGFFGRRLNKRVENYAADQGDRVNELAEAMPPLTTAEAVISAVRPGQIGNAPGMGQMATLEPEVLAQLNLGEFIEIELSDPADPSFTLTVTQQATPDLAAKLEPGRRVMVMRDHAPGGTVIVAGVTA